MEGSFFYQPAEIMVPSPRWRPGKAATQNRKATARRPSRAAALPVRLAETAIPVAFTTAFDHRRGSQHDFQGIPDGEGRMRC